MNIPSALAKTTIVALLVSSAAAHELQDNRATLVLRDRTHLSVTVYISYSEVLHKALAPQRPFQEFLLTYSAMDVELLEKELRRAQARFQIATRLRLFPDGETELTNWIWPDVEQVQSLLQQRVMQAVVDANGHFHEAPMEVHADANAGADISGVQVQFPEEFGRVLVVAYRPNQVWVERKSLSPVIRF
jgi:hypothetical protein